MPAGQLASGCIASNNFSTGPSKNIFFIFPSSLLASFSNFLELPSSNLHLPKSFLSFHAAVLSYSSLNYFLPPLKCLNFYHSYGLSSYTSSCYLCTFKKTQQIPEKRDNSLYFFLMKESYGQSRMWICSHWLSQNGNSNDACACVCLCTQVIY